MRMPCRRGRVGVGIVAVIVRRAHAEFAQQRHMLRSARCKPTQALASNWARVHRVGQRAYVSRHESTSFYVPHALNNDTVRKQRIATKVLRLLANILRTQLQRRAALTDASLDDGRAGHLEWTGWTMEIPPTGHGATGSGLRPRSGGPAMVYLPGARHQRHCPPRAGMPTTSMPHGLVHLLYR